MMATTPTRPVAALTAQPLAALPPYGCGVPLAGSERLVRGNSTAGSALVHRRTRLTCHCEERSDVGISQNRGG